jgi:hypothetical protein
LIRIKRPVRPKRDNFAMKNSRFSPRAAIIGYTVAVAFAFNGLLASVVDAGLAAGGSPFAILCLNANGQPQVPGQSDHSAQCSCTLSCCCATGNAERASSGNVYPSAVIALAQAGLAQQAWNFLAYGLHHLRSPPASVTLSI